MTALNTARLHGQLVLEEGCRLMAYDDATGLPVPPGGVCQGNLTVGVGRDLDTNPLNASELAAVGHDGRTKPITQANAMFLLDNDIAHCVAELNRRAPWWSSLDEIRARVMVDLTFNMGSGWLSTFPRFLNALRTGEYDDAADDLQESKWYIEVGTRGVRLAQMVRTGEDYTS